MEIRDLGSLHGLFLALERFSASSWDSRSRIVDRGYKSREHATTIYDPQSTILNPKSPISNLLISITKWLLTFHLVTFLWLTFMMPDLASIIAFFKGVGNIFEGKTRFLGPPVFSLFFYGSMVVLYHVCGWLREHREHLAHQLARSPLEPLLHGVMIFLVVTNPSAARIDALPQFRAHRHDQALLTLCCIQEGIDSLEIGDMEPAYDTRNPSLISRAFTGTVAGYLRTNGSILRGVADSIAFAERQIRKVVKFGKPIQE